MPPTLMGDDASPFVPKVPASRERASRSPTRWSDSGTQGSCLGALALRSRAPTAAAHT